MSSRSIGLIGGTFDPVHCAHIALARAARVDFDLDEVWFMPCAGNPFKPPAVASGPARLEMLRLALRDEPGSMVSPLELSREAPTYTIDTLRLLRKRYPFAQFTFILGADSLLELHTWKEAEDLFPLARFVTYARPGTPRPRLEDLQLPFETAAMLLQDFRVGVPQPVSASEIRATLKAGKPLPAGTVPESVLEYIHRKGLYR
jgi:nicotinate-nucleotide adenylyltransferase